jgi:hypothetical protein
VPRVRNPRRRAAAIVRRSGGLADVVVSRPGGIDVQRQPGNSLAAMARSTPSAVGERQMLPRQTKSIRFVMSAAILAARTVARLRRRDTRLDGAQCRHHPPVTARTFPAKQGIWRSAATFFDSRARPPTV